ncbi:MAG TPA: amidophosphoribosyltransferase, partial [Gammaproteobacteria bacterium]|nr:amidophosphoribosyltransferase [Gammaproteobacteria bacterium]
RQGYTFLTENDSELIAVWLSDQLSRGLTLEEALESSVRELDGVFTYIISTTAQIGMAKDRWAIKPLSVFSNGREMVTATEEQAVRKLYTDEVRITNLDGPGYSTTWDVLPAAGE